MRRERWTSPYKQAAPRRSLAVAASAVVAVGLIVLAVLDVEEQADVEPTGSARQPAAEKAIAAAAARIASESLGGTPPPEILGRASAEANPDAPAAPVADAPAPPRGYTFVAHAGEMPKARTAVGSTRADGVRPEWLGSADTASALTRQAADAGRDWAFGWIRLAADATHRDLARDLAGTGGAMAGGSGRMVRARLPAGGDRLRRIAALPTVDGVGTAPAAAKLAGFAGDAPAWRPGGHRPVFVTLMADDPDQRWRTALEDLGATVGRHDPDIRVYEATATKAVVDRLAAADFVLAVEPIGLARALHDTAVPALGSDALRAHAGTPGLFTGTSGASVPIGVLDTGLNLHHRDIAANRASVCGANFASFQPGEEDRDLTVDAGGHGTHVTGTIAGNGHGTARYAGMAPGVRHIRFGKVLSRLGFGTDADIVRGMDFLAEPSACGGSDSVTPRIVNMSLGASGKDFEGRDAPSRKLDAVSWSKGQLYVVAQSNDGTAGFSDFGAAKNSLSVGAAFDSGEAAPFTSVGPSADGRLQPQVVATGVDVCSARGGGGAAGYDCEDGTSMASPAAAGVAALLMDAAPRYASSPAAVRARLLAGAVRPDPWLAVPAAFAAHNTGGPAALQAVYGVGMISARTSILNRDGADGWSGGSADAGTLASGEFAYRDIEVPAGASRLDVVLAWDEPPADTLANAVLNDLDLWLDHGADCGDGACGERSSTSRVDNVEWIFVSDPDPGTYRLKVVAERVYGAAPRAELAWTVIRGASTPELRVGVVARAAGPRPAVDVTVSATGYVATGSRLHLECRGDEADCAKLIIERASVGREDELKSDAAAALPGEPDAPASLPPDSTLPLGEIAAGEEVEVALEFAYGGDAPVRLHAVATSWNARGASASVVVRPPGWDGDDPPDATVPSNDDFDQRVGIDGAAGSVAVDLARATAEPGEPLYRGPCLLRDCFGPGVLRPLGWYRRPRGSVWFAWTASRTDLARFSLETASDGGGAPDGVLLGVYRGGSIAGLRGIAVNHREEPDEDADARLGEFGVIAARRTFHRDASFLADAGETYFVRVAADVPAPPLRLRWSQGAPPNDRFAAAEALAGASGNMQGSNAGATLESGESFGPLAATTWYRWTATGDVPVAFAVDTARLRVVAFEGDALDSLRLVSGYPSDEAVFRPRAGTVYRIAVAAPDAFRAGSAYRLSWKEADPPAGPADDLAGADDATVRELEWTVGERHTVEPGEPAESGVRTRWWSWLAPETRRYTWRLEARRGLELGFDTMAFAAFEGTDIGDLNPVATAGSGTTARGFAFEAVADRQYRISVGWPIGDAAAFARPSAEGALRWGETPPNDERGAAIALASTRGATEGSSAFATSATGELAQGLGGASLWWTWEAPTDGWFRFEAGGRFAVAVYEGGADAAAGRSWLRADGAAVFHAAAGTRYTLRVGRTVSTESDFTLRWRPAAAPAWLRYDGALADGADGDGDPVRLFDPASLAFDGEGDRLFAAGRDLLHVFARAAGTGELTAMRGTPADGLAGALLAWDGTRSRLLANRCGDWFAFAADPDTAADRYPVTELEAAGDDGDCGTVLFMDPRGRSVYRVVRDAGIDTFSIDESGGLAFVDRTGIAGLLAAAPAADGVHVYAAADDTLTVLRRDAATGSLAAAETRLVDGAAALAVAAGDAHLFVVAPETGTTTAYALEEGVPRQLGEVSVLAAQTRVRGGRPWRRLVARGPDGVDLFGRSAAASVRAAGFRAVLEDVLGDGRDRFGNDVPLFGVAGGLAASADGRHVYAASRDHGILTFARVPARGAGDAYEPLETLSVATGTVGFGDATDSEECIAVSDTDVDGVRHTVRESKWQSRPNADWPWKDVAGTETTGELCPYTPSSAGHYRLVAVVEVDGAEGRYASNAIVLDDHADDRPDATSVAVPSATEGWLEDADDADWFAVPVEASGTLTAHTEGWIDVSGTLYDAEGERVADDDDSGTGRNFRIRRAVAAGSHYVRVASRGGAHGAYTLHVAFEEGVDDGGGDGPDDPGEDGFDLDPDNDAPRGIAHGDGRFYVADADDGAVYVYEGDGRHVPSARIELHSGNTWPEGMAFDDGRLHVLDWLEQKVFAYELTGSRATDRDFDLDASNAWPTGIAVAAGMFRVVDPASKKVYAYAKDGQRNAEADFDMQSPNGAADGIASADGRLHVLDVYKQTVYAYADDGAREAESDFALGEDNADGAGITRADGRFHVVDGIDGRVYAYSGE